MIPFWPELLTAAGPADAGRPRRRRSPARLCLNLKWKENSQVLYNLNNSHPLELLSLIIQWLPSESLAAAC
jgi:hypothetical protein